MLRANSLRSTLRSSLGASSDAAWLEDSPGSLADLNLNIYEADLLANQLSDLDMERVDSGHSASSSWENIHTSKTRSAPAMRNNSRAHSKMSSREAQQGPMGRGVLAANAKRSGFLEAEKEARGPFRLSSLCVGLLGSSLEDLMDEIQALGSILPQNAKGPLLAIARRRGALNDKVLVALVDESFEILDVSGMAGVTDAAIEAVAKVCTGLKAVDIRCCPNLSPKSVECLVRHCLGIHTLRLGGDVISNRVAQRSIKHLIPQLQALEDSSSWEEVNIDKVAVGAGALDWLLWPSIDEASLLRIENEIPRVTVNPQRRRDLPYYARLEEPLDGPLLEGMDPASWAHPVEHGNKEQPGLVKESTFHLLPIAERFRLAYVARFERTAAKRAKNKRQQERRAEKDFFATDLDARARTLANMVH